MLRLKVPAKWKAGLIIGLILFAACQRNRTDSVRGITIAGELKAAGSEMIRLSELDVKAVSPIDSMLIREDGKFSFQLNQHEGSIYLLTLSPAQKLLLVAGPGDNIRISGDAGKLINTARITGSTASAWLLDFERFTLHNESESDSLAKIFMNSRSDPAFAGIRQHLDSAYADIVSRQRLYMERFINQHPASLASLIVLNRKFGPNFIFSEDKNAGYFVKVDSGLMSAYPGNKHTVNHHSRVAAIIKKQIQHKATDSLLMPGNTVPDVRLSNEEGVPVSLSSLKGKVILVYFWAAMDGPSRKFIRQLIPVYQANKNRGFGIFGVAIEPNKSLWLNAVNLDKPGGIQVIADGGTESPVAALFGIDSIPEAILIDRHGKIIKRNISIAEIRRKLPAQLQLK